jgi:hypothetical protein
MNTPQFGFYFEKALRGASQGAISPAEQFFEGSLAEASLVRETGQNSIDARAGNDPVTMIFELADMDTDTIPGITGLRSHIEQVEKHTRGAQGHKGMLLAHNTVRRETVPVLRISDYGTKGLAGSESVDNPNTPLSALTRGAGISADDGARGGSFGIGSAVGPMASDMSTVFYTSLPLNSSDVIFAGYSSLATHRDADGTWRVGDGFFTDLDYAEDFRYQRNPSPLAPFDARTVPGTDTYVLGYRKASIDPDLQHIKVAFMRNFLLAIHRGVLVVRGITSSGVWHLDAASLADHVTEDPEAAAFYRAINDPDPISAISPRFGKVSLYINVDESLDKTLHTITMRTPLMKIDTFRHNSIPVKYAAVLECSDDKGNTLLRALEPPQHHRWDPERAPGGKVQLDELKKFVREGLRSRVKQQIGDQVEIKGLSRFLPAQLSQVTAPATGTSGTPSSEPGTDKESSTVRGAEEAPREAPIGGRKTVKVGVRTEAGSEGTSPTDKGKDRGGSNSRQKKGGKMPGTGTQGEGAARITTGDVRFRSWSDASTGHLCLALTAYEDIAGDLELVALGPGGSMEDDYKLPIAQGVMVTNGAAEPLSHQGNVLSDLQLQAGVTSQIRLTLSSVHRYRLGIK